MTDESVAELRAVYGQIGAIQVDETESAVRPALKDYSKADLHNIVSVWNQIGDVLDELYTLASDASMMRDTLLDIQQSAVDALAVTRSRLEDPDGYWKGRLEQAAG